jgi:hypothetical protein
MKRRLRFSGLFSFIFLLLSLAVVFNSQYIYDQFQAFNYKPTAEVQSIVERSSLSSTGKLYLYASNANVDIASDFNANCNRQEAGNAILGCYTNRKIYIFNVNNSELDGIKEVTAVHEMLHAAWDRLSQSDKDHISILLEAAYQSNKTPELTSRMDYYSRNEAGERSNELHSIVGTEMKNISTELENYYSKYFIDRTQVVKLFEKYNSVFTELSKQSDQLFSDLTALNKQITDKSNVYEQNASILRTDIEIFNRDAKSGNFSSTYQFNQSRSKLIARSNQVESDRAVINNMIDDYQNKYDQYQKLIIQNQTLNNSIDSHVEAAPSL